MLNEAEEHKEQEVKQEVSDEVLDKAIEALDADKIDDENIKIAADAIFGGEDKAILPNSDAETIDNNADNFMKVAEENGITPDDESENTENKEPEEKKAENESYGIASIDELILEAEGNKQEKKKNFILKLLDKILGHNKAAQENPKLKKYSKRVKKAKENKANKDSQNKENAKNNSNKFSGKANMESLKKDYYNAGKDFVAHTCTATYKSLKSAAEKDADVKELAQNLSKNNGDSIDNYLKDIKDINERKHVDAGACALALAKKYKEANADKKSPYAAKTTKEALALASRYKKAFPKYYNRAHNLFADEYTRGINDAQKALKAGETLKDPITGESINYEVLGPFWQAGKSLNDFFMKEPLNVTTLGPKMIFGLYNMLTSKTAKNIYSGIFKFGRAIAQRFLQKEQAQEVADNSALFDCTDTKLKEEFDELIKQYTETEDEVDKNDNTDESNGQEEEKQPQEDNEQEKENK